MDVDESEIRTGVDSLIKLLYDKKRLSLEETSKALSLPRERLEEWARVLEGEGILRIEYAFTKTYLVWTAGEAESGKGGREEGGSGKLAGNAGEFFGEGEGAWPAGPGGSDGNHIEPSAGTDSEISRLLARVQIKGEQIRKLESDYLELYKNLDPKLLDAQARLEKLKELEQKREGIYARHSGSLEEMKKTLSGFSSAIEETGKQVDSLHSKYSELQRQISGTEGKLEEYQKIARKIATVQAELERAGSAVSEKLKREMEALHSPDEAAFHVQKLQKASDELERLKKDFSSHFEQLARVHVEAGKDKAVRGNLEKLFSEADRKAEKINGDLSELEKKASYFGDSAKEALGEIRHEREELSALLSAESMVRDLLLSATSFEKVRAQTEGRMREIEEGRSAVVARIAAIQEALDALPAQAERKKKIDAALSEISEFHKEIEKSVLAAKALARDIGSFEAKGQARELEKAKRAVSSSVQKQLSGMEKLKGDYLKVYNELSGSLSGIDSEMRAHRTELDEQMKKADFVINKMKEFEGKKGDVKKVLDSITALRTDQEKLEKKVAELLELSKSSPAKTPQNLRYDFEMSSRDYERFEQKREKLRGMIDELWRGKPN